MNKLNDIEKKSNVFFLNFDKNSPKKKLKIIEMIKIFKELKFHIA